ncbi:glutamate-5-semialdehyde dehydrogenase [Magnetococcus marinus MC-1]|uniref:Gamma-glutamyl phosphate reductase n=1 Tax=Magnetococcus marinus (strain ATCC BAA-1437 / JCM 17883 / MC-1) TaxID=156889 RepID=PROA_MAGMM|nr:glutamate-5-semialdehyde dehydrogenase [Magnetococcus marinus]A0LCZ1.1 RecName: Full=Gamma-glutamyl phosphate reductase; Short=GPR; AltName: Full=Glutamate-5-semialdehyde dehydrogenase; AltName: Full=Glutamyl-gamma-semialdehyde dehydrogenase; Short=GSA dehydrogenase [Magnetococcus marinus MC-1]ABK45834.1 glutamate-5-semialdehyde dehydrogenase [Magnetococcus marinus MC-1]
MSNDSIKLIDEIGKKARKAARQLAWLDSGSKNATLHAMADALIACKKILQVENEKDLEAGEKNGLTDAMLDRLRLTDQVIASMAEGIRQVAALPDPIGEINHMRRLANQLQVGKMRVPLGVIGIIYESRPNVTADAAALCVKSGNAVILRGGSEAFHSNRAIAAALAQGMEKGRVPSDAVQVVSTTDRAAVSALLKADQYVDIIIPRGGKGLIQRVMDEATIPVIKHLDGICHTYIDADADPAKAIDITFNGKMQRTGVCNATETLLIHEKVAKTILPALAKRLNQADCVLRGCPETIRLVGEVAPVIPATEEDWDTEYLAAILAIRVVKNLEEAMDHIDAHSSRHTEVIVTENHATAMRFVREVDASAVMVNASSRFNDGFQFGLGAEMGISTDKLHVRGPVGLEGLTCEKWIVLGDGQLRS